jgi:pimeloyl-ACP methyl ester carboxylesterase
MSAPGARSRLVLALVWFGVGSALVWVAVWLTWTRGTALLSGHPALLVVIIASALTGLLALVWSVATLAVGDRLDREGERQNPVRRTKAQRVRLARRRIILAVPALLASAVLFVTMIVARPVVATATAEGALYSQDGVDVVERITWYELQPNKKNDVGGAFRPTTGLIFLPGARVDPRAYAALLRPLARAGFLTVVLREPLGFAVMDRDHAQTVIDRHPEIESWAVGGHSLGGVVAASFADNHPQVKGLVLYAAYPAAALHRTDLQVVSIYGGADERTTPADIAKSKADLPPATSYVEIPGAAHSSFGDYGPQPGDGEPSGDPAAARQQIRDSTQALLQSIVPPPPPPPAPPKRK